jgi:hypothetical protein
VVAPGKKPTHATYAISIELARADFELPWFRKLGFSYDAMIDCSSFLGARSPRPSRRIETPIRERSGQASYQGDLDVNVGIF